MQAAFQPNGGSSVNPWQPIVVSGSACGPVIVQVFKTGGRRALPSPVGSTPTRFRHLVLSEFDNHPFHGTQSETLLKGSRCDENVDEKRAPLN
jgi:hypothetical protein